jgi:hypothetical protein
MTENNQKSAPIFLQALWRARSTYWWSKFRTDPSLMCFYEPLHEALRHEKPDANDVPQWKSDITHLRHPDVAQHYFAEFPLQDHGGVSQFQETFTANNYALAAQESDHALSHYFTSLADHARAHDKRPMFQPNRATLRGAWMKNAFEGTHIYLSRDYESLFQSYLSFRGYPGYFLRGFSLVIAQNASAPLFREIAQWANLPNTDGQNFDKATQTIEDYLEKNERQYDVAYHRDVTAFFWVMALAQATQYADIMIDGSCMGDAEYVQTLLSQVEAKTECSLDLSDYVHQSDSERGADISQDMKLIIQNALKINQPDWSVLEAQKASPQTMKMLDHVL